jgi:hypothetical protein
MQNMYPVYITTKFWTLPKVLSFIQNTSFLKLNLSPCLDENKTELVRRQRLTISIGPT